MRTPRRIKYFLVFLIFIFSCLNANEENLEHVYRVLATLPEWNETDILIQELEGGLTNANYKAHVGSKDYFVRCGSDHNIILGVSLDHEWKCTSTVAKAGLAPRTILYNPEERVFISEFVEVGDRVIDLRDPITLIKFCCLVRSLHSLDVNFDKKFCPFETINIYIENAKENGIILPDIIFSKIIPWMEQLQRNTVPLAVSVPCHFDLHHGNVLDDGNRFWIVDWEYAGMGDPFFDLAIVASTEDFSDKEMCEFLQTYLNGRNPSEKEINHLYSMRILADIRWCLWCYLQSKISQQVNQPFLPFANFFLKNALNRLEAQFIPIN